ncbi:uncharacterized protein TNCV_4567371 [Trichonephila clavipes]|nr:uncharacterized protein TNCV_4567371 [Trichonephila clavipes]
MPGKRARRHFSQLSEFERGRIIEMKTAGWSTRRAAGQVDRSDDESRFVVGTDDNRVRVWRRPDSSMASPLPDLSPVEHVWVQLKRQMPSCHSVHDLELVVQDLWAQLPQDNVRCPINLMPDRVASCIAAGGGSTRY